MTLEQPLADKIAWSARRKWAFRFFSLYFLFYIFFSPNGVLPFSEPLSEIYLRPFHQLIPWIGAHILHLSYPITVFTNGSGDTTYDYVILLFLSVLSLVAAIGWSLFDRKPRNYDQGYYWLTMILRYYLAATMLTYGMVKVIKLQFPFPGLGTLMEPYGKSSPMGLAWNFMGYSRGYNYFAGCAEVLAGCLLFFRRTTTAGALLTLIVSAHIMAMNYCFDIPVKLLSTMMVVMSAFLLAPNARTITGFLFRYQTVRMISIPRPVIRKKWLRILRIIGKCLFIGFEVISLLAGLISSSHQYGDKAPKTALYGIYQVRTFIRNKDTIAPLLTDTSRWKLMIIDGSKTYTSSSILSMNDSVKKSYNLKLDIISRTMKLTLRGDSNEVYDLRYNLPGKDSMVLLGQYTKDGKSPDSVEIHLKVYDWKNFLLVRRGFHWINEYPLNR